MEHIQIQLVSAFAGGVISENKVIFSVSILKASAIKAFNALDGANLKTRFFETYNIS